MKTKTKKHIYVISNPSFEGMYKVGVATDIRSRLGNYQTSDPNRGFVVEYRTEKPTPHYDAIEKHIHKTFPNKHEWVRGELKDIIALLPETPLIKWEKKQRAKIKAKKDRKRDMRLKSRRSRMSPILFAC